MEANGKHYIAGGTVRISALRFLRRFIWRCPDDTGSALAIFAPHIRSAEGRVIFESLTYMCEEFGEWNGPSTRPCSFPA